MIEYFLIPIIVSFLIGLLAVSKYGISDELFFDSLYVTDRYEINDYESISQIITDNLKPIIIKSDLKAQESFVSIDPPLESLNNIGFITAPIGRRTKIEIYLQILKEIKEGIRKPTRIMYHTNLSWRPLTRILESLVAQKLIEEKIRGRSKEYLISEKGDMVLRYYLAGAKAIKDERIQVTEKDERDIA